MDLTNLIENIKKLCKKRNITINKFLEDCSINRNFMTNLKNQSIPSLDKIIIIASYFNVSIDYLVGLDNSRTEKLSKKDLLKLDLFDKTKDITDEMLDEVKQYALMVLLREENNNK